MSETAPTSAPEPRRRIIILTWLKTVGCYARDAQGRHLATWSGPAVACAVCGVSVTRGWCRALSDEVVCHTHVEMRQPDVDATR